MKWPAIPFSLLIFFLFSLEVRAETVAFPDDEPEATRSDDWWNGKAANKTRDEQGGHLVEVRNRNHPGLPDVTHARNAEELLYHQQIIKAARERVAFEELRDEATEIAKRRAKSNQHGPNHSKACRVFYCD